jgi:ABC-type bacteriocin/lantibiotic exporter with double-glycine peptidase domain
MFDLAILANPARLKRDFLATTEVAEQAMPDELRAEFNKIREQDPELLMTGAFWWDFVRTYKQHISLLVVGRGAMILLVLASVLASQRILDESNTITAAICLLVFYTVVQLVMKGINAWTALLQSQLLVCTRTFVTLRMNVKLLRMGQLSTDEFTTGNLKTLVSSDVYRIADLFHAVARNGLPCLLGLIILGPVIVYYMGTPGLFAMVVGFGVMPLAFALAKYVHKQEMLIKAEEDNLATIIGEWVTNVRLLRFLGWEKLMRTRVAAHVRSLVIESTKQHGVNLINFGVSVSWWLFPIIALIWANEAWGDNRDLVTLFASVWMLNHITLYIRWLPNIFIDYASAAASVSRLNKLIQHKDITDDLLPDWQRSVASVVPIRVHFNNVCYQYEGEGNPLVIKDLYLNIDLNKHVSLIGKVGSGKSTLLKLLCAEIKPTSGSIQVEFDNGVIADMWHKNIYHKFRSSIGYMPQEAYLSNASIGTNVALSTDQPVRDVMHAIRLAELEADMGQWGAGLEEEVGETGVNLSGGQKQRVSLARALYSRRDYLVLDDPLSAVDTETESALMENLLSGPDGFLLCSHRLSELQRTDRLLVLDDGRLIEDGQPKHLLNDPTSEFSKQLRAGEFEEDPIPATLVSGRELENEL